MIDEGYIKYRQVWDLGPAPEHPHLEALVAARNDLWERGWVGETPEGIGFGNVSLRASGGLIISGTQTGHKPVCTAADFSLVDAWDIPANTAHCTGPVAASSESLTHAMIYDCFPGCQFVLHIHHRDKWLRGLKSLPFTPADVPYGTPEMALAVQGLRERFPAGGGVFAMAGHEDGLVAFGSSIAKCIGFLVKI